MDRPILVTGGTGTLGRLVVARLREAGRDVRVLTRHGGGAEADATVEYLTGDLATGAGIEAAVEGDGGHRALRRRPRRRRRTRRGPWSTQHRGPARAISSTSPWSVRIGSLSGAGSTA